MHGPICNRKEVVVPGGNFAHQPSVKHCGASGNKIAHPNVFQRGNLLLSGRRPVAAIFPIKLMIDPCIMETKRAVGMVIEEISLLLKFMWRGPVIIAIQ